MKFHLAAILGVALAAHPPPRLPSRLPAGKEYFYHYYSTIESGIPLEDTQVSATIISSDVHLQVPHLGHALLRLDNFKISANSGLESSFSSIDLEDKAVSEDDLNALKLPILIRYGNAVIHQLQFASEERTWSANIKRAVANMFQLDLNAVTAENQDGFVVDEMTVEGQCEVSHKTTIFPEKKKTVVKKTVNFGKCSRRPEQTFDNLFASRCPECHFKAFVPETNYTYTFDENILEKTETQSAYTVFIKAQGLMETKIRTVLKLKNTSEIIRSMDEPEGEKEELMFSIGAQESVGIERIKKTLEKLMEIEDNTPAKIRHFSKLVDLLRLCSKDMLHTIDHWSKQFALKKRTILYHAFAIAGTDNTVQHLFEKHMFDLDIATVAQLLNSIQDTIYPSAAIVDQIIAFARTPRCRKNIFLQQANWFAFGALAHGVIARNHSEQLVEEYEQILLQEWEGAKTIYDKILALKTYANAGLDVTADELQEIIANTEEDPVVRTEAVNALRRIRIPQVTRAVLMNTYLNTDERNFLRIAALQMLFKVDPTASEIQRVAHSLEKEDNPHIELITRGLLTSEKYGTVPCYRNVSDVIRKLGTSQRSKQQFGYIKSDQGLMGRYLGNASIGIGVHSSISAGNESYFPQNVFISMETNVGSTWIKNLLLLGFTHNGIDKAIVEELMPKIPHDIVRPTMTEYRRQKESGRYNWIDEKEPFGFFTVAWRDLERFILPVNQTLIDLLKDKLDDLDDLLDAAKDVDFDLFLANRLYEETTIVPTSAGISLTFGSSLTAVASGNAKISKEKYTWNLKAESSLATTHLQHMKLGIPSVQTGVNIERSFQISFPLDIDLEIRKSAKYLQFILKSKKDEGKKFVAESAPFNFMEYDDSLEENKITAKELEDCFFVRTEPFRKWGFKSNLTATIFRYGRCVGVKGALLSQMKAEAQFQFNGNELSRQFLERKSGDDERASARRERSLDEPVLRSLYLDSLVNEEAADIDSIEPVMKIQLTEFPHKLCFSVQPVPECPLSTIPGRQVKRMVEFGCVSTHSSAARTMKAAWKRGDDISEQTMDLPVSYEEKLRVPKQCFDL